MLGETIFYFIGKGNVASMFLFGAKFHQKDETKLGLQIVIRENQNKKWGYMLDPFKPLMNNCHQCSITNFIAPIQLYMA